MELILKLIRILLILCTRMPVQCTWYDDAHYFTIYTGAYTWNDAREICRHADDQLLMIHDEREWSMWIELLNITYSTEHRAVDGIYWFGLHAADAAIPANLYWDNCTEPAYIEPAVMDYPVTNYPCVTIWIRREVFNNAFKDMWLKGRMCNETHSLICLRDVNDCVPTCDEMIINTDVTTCDILCDGTTCYSTYLQQINMCHVMPVAYSDTNKFYLCYLPSENYIPSTCANSQGTYTITTTDNNMNVTDTVCIDVPSNQTNITTEPTDCTCLCSQLWMFLAQTPPEEANLTIEEKVEKIVEELTVDKKNTSVTLRKYVSVMDDRASSVGIGIVAGIIIFSIFGIIVLFDLSTIWHEISHILIKVFKFLRPNRVMHQEPLSELAEAIGSVPFALATGGRFKKFDANTQANPSFIMTVGGRFRTVPKHNMTAKMEHKPPVYVLGEGGRFKAFKPSPATMHKKPNRKASGLGWLMRETHVYNDMELPEYPHNIFEANPLPGKPPISTSI